MSSAATNFIIHHVEQNAMDVHFQLTEDDVDAIVRERGSNALSEPALFNIAILDHLLTADVTKADVMVASVARLNDDALRFLQAYLTAGLRRPQFLERFARKSTRVLPYLIAQADLDDVTRLQLVSDALANLAPGVKYFTDEASALFFADHYAEFPALVADAITPEAAARIAIVFAMAPLKLTALEPLTDTARREFVARSLFTINRANLLAALGNEADLALDSIRILDEGVYDYVLNDLDSYLASIEGHSATNGAANSFIAVISDVLERDADRLDEIVARASVASRVPDLMAAPVAAWPTLAKFDRFPATFTNVTQYILEIGTLDADLAVVLETAREISESSTAAEADKVQLALTILAARPLIHSTIRVPLVMSLELDEQLDVSAIKAENSPLFALLIENNLIADEAASYAHVAHLDWEWRAQLIRASRKFKTYMTPELVGDDLSLLLTSTKISKPVKLLTLDEATKYAVSADAAGRLALARFALANNRGLPVEVVEQLAGDRADATTVITLLQPHLDALDDTRLFAILRSQGGAYAQLAQVGRDRPVVPNTSSNRALLDSLMARGIVSTFDTKGSSFIVNKKHK